MEISCKQLFRCIVDLLENVIYLGSFATFLFISLFTFKFLLLNVHRLDNESRQGTVYNYFFMLLCLLKMYFECLIVLLFQECTCATNY